MHPGYFFSNIFFSKLFDRLFSPKWVNAPFFYILPGLEKKKKKKAALVKVTGICHLQYRNPRGLINQQASTARQQRQHLGEGTPSLHTASPAAANLVRERILQTKGRPAVSNHHTAESPQTTLAAHPP